MKYLKGTEAVKYLSDIVYERKQVHKYSVDLTVKRIYKASSGAQLDFGGSEFKAAKGKSLKPQLRDSEDEYGWWELKEGLYYVKYNELLTLAPGQKAFIQMHPRLLESGIMHSSLTFEESGEILIPLMCLKETSIKENARVSELRILKD